MGAGFYITIITALVTTIIFEVWKDREWWKDRFKKKQE